MSTRHARDDRAVFAGLSDAEVHELLASCLDVARWVQEVKTGRPYAGRADLLRQARESAVTLTPAEVESALARHPRIGEQAGAGHDAGFSTQEQSGVERDDSALEALRTGNMQYEARFDRIFLIRAAGRSAPEILAELERRLRSSDEAEMAEVVTQLGEIAVLRLEQLIPAQEEHDGHHEGRTQAMSTVSTHVLDTSRGCPAEGIAVQLARVGEPSEHIADGTTDADGRVGDLGPEDLPPGTYRLTFATAEYFARTGTDAFFPEVSIQFCLADPSAHYHLPVLLSPFTYTTYRGS